MILTRDGKEVIAIYKQNGDEVDEVKDANGRLVYTNTREITGTLPLSFTSRGKPLSDYRISGNAVQDGTPTPDYPVDVQGVGERTGNLFDYSAITTGERIQWSNGTPYADTSAIMSDYIPVTDGDYTLNMGVIIIGYASDKSYVGAYQLGNKFGKLNSYPVSTFTVLSSSNVKFVKLMSFGAYPPITNTLMLNVGSTALPYEPYGYKLQLTVNGTESPIYLGDAQTTRKIKKFALTGEEYWEQNTKASTEDTIYMFTTSIAQNTYVPSVSICSHFEYKDAFNIRDVNGFHLLSGYGGLRFRIMRTIADTTNNFKSYLAAQYAAGTPVTIWYVLVEQETAVVNEPLMKIGNYADTIAMAQAGVTIPTVSGTNVLDMSSPVKPSEVYIKGKGIKAIT